MNLLSKLRKVFGMQTVQELQNELSDILKAESDNMAMRESLAEMYSEQQNAMNARHNFDIETAARVTERYNEFMIDYVPEFKKAKTQFEDIGLKKEKLQDRINKAKSGHFKDNDTNRKKGIVGMPYGHKNMVHVETREENVGKDLTKLEYKLRYPKKNTLMFVSPTKLMERHLLDDPNFSILNKTNQIGKRVDKAKEYLNNYVADQRWINPNTKERDEYSKATFEPSIASIENGKLGFTDGRHRVLAAKELGFPEVAIEVPKRQVHLFDDMKSESKGKSLLDAIAPNMAKNLSDILSNPTIKKALDNGTLDAKSLIEKVINAKTGKNHKYIHRKPDGKGGWVYTYKDDDKAIKLSKEENLEHEDTGLTFGQYTDKAFLVGGKTKENLDLLRSIKKDLGVGIFVTKLSAWMFPTSFQDRVLGYIFSKASKEGKDDIASQALNQKNSSLSKGDEVSISGVEGKVEKNVSDSEDIKYNVTLKSGEKLEGVSEKVLDVQPETNDKKISDIVSNAQPENRAKTEKKLYGLKPVADVHNYSLPEYLKMHGLTEDDIQSVITAFTNPKTKDEVQKRASSGGRSGEYKSNSGSEGLTKRQLIGKLVYQHYQAVKAAIEQGLELKPEVLNLYSDLKDAYSTKRKELSEEHKRKISEALKGRGKPESEKPENESNDNESDKSSNVDNFSPKDGQVFEFTGDTSSKENPISIKTKDYSDFDPKNIKIPNPKNILSKDRPKYIPEINLDKFSNNFALSSAQIGVNKYLVALDSFNKKGGASSLSVSNINSDSDFAIMSLDLLIATEKYYKSFIRETRKAKEKALHEARVERRVKGFNEIMDKLKSGSFSIESGRYGVGKRIAVNIDGGNYYKSISGDSPTKEEINDALNELNDRLKSELSSKPDTVRIVPIKSDSITRDQKNMIKHVYPKNSDGSFMKDSDVYEVYRVLMQDKGQKSIDLDLQAENDLSTFTKGRETSFGDSNTNNALLDKFGVKVKRQNGDQINEKEISEIETALIDVESVFGATREMNKNYGLKISHSGNVGMHAMKAVGVFFDFYKAIGVTMAGGANQFGLTLAHEWAHYMDSEIGKKKGYHFYSDKSGSVANEIAKTLRNNMSKTVKANENYYNRTCECFARALELHFAVEKGNSKLFDAHGFVPKDVYETQLKPLIQQFLAENKDILKSLGIDMFVDNEKQSLDTLQKAFEAGLIDSDTFEKAQRVYKDNAENKRLKRVGKPYGKPYGKAGDQPTTEDKKEPESEEKPEKMNAEELAEHAKNSSESALQTAVKSSPDPEVRQAAHNEIDRRQKEEHIQPEKEEFTAEKKPETGEEKGAKDTKEPEKETKEKPEDGGEKEHDVTETENFKKWFNDSKIVDKNGKPKILFHGTNSNFTEFKTDMIASGTGNYGYMGLGFYFSDDEKESKSYGKNIMKTYLSIKNPFIANDKNLEKYAEKFGYEKKPVAVDTNWLLKKLKEKDIVSYNLAKNISELGYEKGWSKFLKTNNSDDAKLDLNDVSDMMEMVNPEHKQEISEHKIELLKDLFNEDPVMVKDYEDSDKPSLVYMTGFGDYSKVKDFTDMLKADGYDGVVAGSEYVVFEPNQIKSATGNEGTFDAKSNDITKSENDTLKLIEKWL